ncbi:MAG TPA: PH domain-containing protein [Luteimonas sp.]|nr:PH domain-containing protein [Luteimonas sp.]
MNDPLESAATGVAAAAGAATPAAPRAAADHAAWADPGWQPLPARARTLFVLGNLVGSGVAAAGLLVPITLLVPSRPLAIALATASLVLLPACGAWLAHKRHRYTRWLLDRDGFALRRGRLWQRETRVPATRVQHLDLRRGPLERRFGLATLVIHTAGTRDSAVHVAGLALADAERLRDHLARQDDRDDDDA